MESEALSRVLLVGPGQLGRVLAGGLVATGVAVDPVLRGQPIAPSDAHELVLVGVGEADLDDVLRAIPPSHRDRVALLQNELSPESWSRHGVVDPTLLVVWFEKKRGRALREVRETELAGRFAASLARALDAMDVRARVLDDAELPAALVVKNLYIVGANVLGLAHGGTTGELARAHPEPTSRVLGELLQIERARLGGAVGLEPEAIVRRVFEAFLADPSHAALGRTARSRLERALARARAHGIEAPALSAIARDLQ